jgi:heptosyltransferase III
MKNDRYNLNGKRVIISRTDSLGDVVLTLPVATILNQLFPECTIIFLGRNYTKSLIECCEYIDEFADWEKLKDEENGLASLNADAIIHVFPRKEIARAAKAAKIPLRLGTTSRLYHWGNCNKLVRLSRRKSPFHEAQLNLKLLIPFGARQLFYLHEIFDFFGLTKIPVLNETQRKLLNHDKVNLILHPGSKGSARDWSLDNFSELIKTLPENKFKLFITGTQQEGEAIRETIFNAFPHVVNLCGVFSLSELIGFIANCDGVIAASTGPLHIAAALGRNVVGIYPPIKPMHPGRWAPIGHCAFYLVADHECSKCRKGNKCSCMDEVTPAIVKNKLLEIFH